MPALPAKGPGGRCRLAPLQRFLSEVTGIAISHGWLHESGVALGNHLLPAWEDLSRQIRTADVLNLDEGSVSESRRRSGAHMCAIGGGGFGRKDRDWILVALSARTALFHFSDTRGARALTALLAEDFSSIIGMDRYSAYNASKSAVRQFCWAHLHRERTRAFRPRPSGGNRLCRFRPIRLRRMVITLSESQKPEVAVLGKRLLAEQEEVFALWHTFRTGDISRKDLGACTALNLARFKRGLIQASTMDHRAVRNLGKDLLRKWDKLWVFLKVGGVEPTSNTAERALRPLVIFQRLLKALHAARSNQPLPALEPA